MSGEGWSRQGQGLVTPPRGCNFSLKSPEFKYFSEYQGFNFFNLIPELKVIRETVCYWEHEVTGKAAEDTRNGAVGKCGGSLG